MYCKDYDLVLFYDDNDGEHEAYLHWQQQQSVGILFAAAPAVQRHPFSR